MIRRGMILMLLSFLGLLAGCKTETFQVRLATNMWWVCDGDKNDSTCGSNPEKGLIKTCPVDGKSIVRYTQLPDESLIVYCK